jgi:hypothetical protein
VKLKQAFIILKGNYTVKEDTSFRNIALQQNFLSAWMN